MLGLRQDMAERMQANYGLMNMPIRKEEMLHVTSEPAEVYFAEGDNLTIFNNIKNESQQEIRLDVINNLMNRIMVSQTENFTYQDTVYISSVLRKLGIRDEKTFMKQVFALQNEHKETKNLLQKYKNHQKILEQFFTEQKEKRALEQKESDDSSKTERRYYMHDEIFQRLETGKIYQDIRLFSKGNRHESQQIYRTELSIGEQATVEQNFLLQDLKKKIINQDVPLYYCHNNQYEYLQEITEQVTENLEEQMSAAVLLNLVDQSYVLRQQQIEKNSHYWYSIAGALFQTAENTWKRYEANLLERKFVSNDILQILEEVSQVKQIENATIQNIANGYTKLEAQIANITQAKNVLLENQTQVHSNEEVNITGGFYHLTQEELELQFLNQNEEVENQTTALTVEQLQEQLNIFNQKNYENYLKMEAIAKSKPQVKERKLDRKRAQKDALRALENPTEVLREYLTTEVQDSVLESQREMESQIYDLFSDETKEIYRQFLQQINATEEIFLQNIMNQPTEAEIYKEIKTVVSNVSQDIPEEVYREMKAYAEYIQSSTAETTNEELRQKIENSQDIQNSKVYEQWIKFENTTNLQDIDEENVIENRFALQEKILEERHELSQRDTNTIVSNVVETMFEKENFIHPEPRVEEEYYQSETQTTISEETKTVKEIDASKEIIQRVLSERKLDFIRQIQTEINENVIDASSITYEIINEKWKHQLQKFENLQLGNTYENWRSSSNVVQKYEQKENEKQKEAILEQQKILEQRNTFIQTDARQVVLNEVENVFEKQKFVHPEQLLEVEEQYKNENYTNVQQHITNREVQIENPKESTHTKEYEQTLETLKQMYIGSKGNTAVIQPIHDQMMNQELEHQLQVFQDLQMNHVYEKWTMPADIVWQMEQTELEQTKDTIFQQEDIIKKTNVISAVESKVNLLEETTKQFEHQTLVHPEEVLELEVEEIYREVSQKTQLHVNEAAFTNLQQNVEKKLKIQQNEQNIRYHQTNQETVFQNIDFVHKVEEQLLSEELLEEIRMQKQNVKREEHTEQTTVEKQKTVHQTVQESVNQIQTHQLNQIEELVQQSVKKQIGDLSDQVYGKIEKKLQTERKRRGYF